MNTAETELDRLLGIMERLRASDGGCPWDREQTFATIAPYTIEEAYEVADAIANGSPERLRSELGDLLFQVVFHARLAEEQGWFAFGDVAASIADKLTTRHPHVFADARFLDAAGQTAAWEAMKAKERDAGQVSLFGGGDAKLLAAAGLWLGWPDLMPFLIMTAFAGGILALCIGAWSLISINSEIKGGSIFRRLGTIKPNVPYGYAFAIGAILAFPQSWWMPAVAA